MKHPILPLTALLPLLACGALHAHVSIVAGNSLPVANTSYEATFNVPHGCSDSEGNTFDTYRVEISLPAGLGSVRPVDSTFGKATVVTDEAGNVTTVVWTKSEENILAQDDHLYKFTLRAKLPDAPFTTLYFPTVQHCHGIENAALTAEWTAVDAEEHDHSTGSSSENPAPALFVLPARTPGWNKYTVNEHVHDLSVFNDAEIIWSGTSAWSANPNTATLIEADEAVSTLEAIHPGTDIWVKY